MVISQSLTSRQTSSGKYEYSWYTNARQREVYNLMFINVTLSISPKFPLPPSAHFSVTAASVTVALNTPLAAQ